MKKPAALLALLIIAGPLEAARIGELTQTDWTEQAVEFFTLGHPVVRTVLLGSALMGLCCGLLGGFLVVRRMALVGDTLSHAVLPGVALGFLWNMTKDPFAIFIGAVAAGLLGAVVFGLIRDTTPIKEDSALGMVLAGFYGVGIALFTMIQNLPTANKAGLDKYLFGQAAALSEGDLRLMAVVTVVSLVLTWVFYKEFLTVSFDRDYARALGMPSSVIHYTIILLLAFAVVVALQAVGVVLVSAMLITPATAAYLLTDRLHRMLLLAALLGILSGVLGAFFSYLGSGLPTGPFMVLGASVIFAGAFAFAPRHGVLPRLFRRVNRTRRIGVENTLKGVYHVREDMGFPSESVTLGQLSARMNEDLVGIEKRVTRLVRDGLATVAHPGPDHTASMTQDSLVTLTPDGWARACAVVRNHRLWELYLTTAADYPSDHVHDDAEVIEHVIGEKIVREIERRLDYPKRDPHGKAIPGISDIESARNRYASHDAASGYHSTP